MKPLRITLLVLLLILFLLPTFAFSQDIWSNGHHKKLGRINDKGVILDDSNHQNFGKKIGRIKNGVVYDSPHGGTPIGRIDEDGKIWDKVVGGKPIGRWEGGKVYDRGSYGGIVIGETKNKDGASFFLLKEGGLLEKDFTKRKWNE